MTVDGTDDRLIKAVKDSRPMKKWNVGRLVDYRKDGQKTVSTSSESFWYVKENSVYIFWRWFCLHKRRNRSTLCT